MGWRKGAVEKNVRKKEIDMQQGGLDPGTVPGKKVLHIGVKAAINTRLNLKKAVIPR